MLEGIHGWELKSASSLDGEGFEAAVVARAKEIALFASAFEAFSKSIAVFASPLEHCILEVIQANMICKTTVLDVMRRLL
nr:hypothetical protein [Tanacetum cinerariifolium]